MSQFYRTKNKVYLRILAIILVFAFIFTNAGLIYATPVYAAEQQTPMPNLQIASEKASDHNNKGIGNKRTNVKIAGPNDRPANTGAAPIEITSKRTKYSKRFLNPDGSFTEEIFTEPQFYQDPSDKKLKKIDNNLKNSLEKSGFYENYANEFKSFFAKQSGANDLISVQKNNQSLTLTPVNSRNVNGTVKDNVITYPNIFPDVDARYYILNSAIKEDLILHKKPNENTFTFELKVKNLETEIDKDGTIIFKDSKGKTQWSFAKPYMTDAKEKYSDQVSLNIRKEQGKTYVDVVADRKFLDDPETVYPVTIDPTIQYVNDWDVVQDNDIASARPTSSYPTSTTLFTGYNSTYGSCRTLVKFFLPTLPSGSKIISANFNAYQSKVDSSTVTIGLYRITSSWTESVTWNTQPTTASTAESSKTSNAYNQYWQWYLTNLVKDWYSGAQANYGLMLKQDNETSSPYRSFKSVNSGTNTPSLTINYQVDPTGAESYWTFTGDGVNVANGNLLLQGTDISIPGRGISLNLGRAYNSRSQTSTSVGYGWQLNIPQIKGSGEGPFTYIDEDGTEHIFSLQVGGTYAGPPGNFLDFAKTAGGFTITSPDGIKMEFNTSGQLTKIYDTQRDTNSNPINVTNFIYSSGKLTAIKDASDRTLTFAYDGSNRIDTITDNASRVVNYDYDANGNLSAVTDQENKTTGFGYDANHNLTSITDPNNHVTTIEYDANDRVYQVKRKITVNGVLSDSITTYTYDEANSKTTVTDPKNVPTVYHFDENGNVLDITEDPNGLNQITRFTYDADENVASVTDPKNNVSNYTWESGNGNLLEAETPKDELYTYDYDNNNNLVEATDPNSHKDSYGYDSKNNNLFAVNAGLFSKASKYNLYGNVDWETSPMAAADNLIINPSMVGDDNGDGVPNNWNKYLAGGTATFARGTGIFDGYAASISSVTDSAVVTNNRVFSIAPINDNTQYVLSGYIKTANLTAKAAFLKIDFFNAGLSWIGQIKTPLLGGTNGWTRVQVAINKNNIPSNAAYIQAAAGMFAATGTASFDNIQLETGSAASAYNLVQNSSMELDQDGDQIPDGWMDVNFNKPGGDGLDTGKHLSGDKAIKIAGASGVNKYILQSNYINGKAGDKLTLSGWSFADNPNPSGGVYGIQVTLTNNDGTTSTFGNDFNPNKPGEWQQIAAQITVAKNFSQAMVELRFSNQRGNAWFDGMRLQLGNNLTKYTYTTDNNYVNKVTDATGNEVTFGYDSVGNKTSVKDGLNHETTYTYDKLNRLKTVTDALFGLTSYDYDGNGNLTKVTDARNKITQYGYNEFNQVKSITDALNKVTDIKYDIAGLVSEISYPNGKKVELGYDNLGRPNSIKHNGVSKYSFGYDKNGNKTSMTDVVKSQTTTYGYDANNNVQNVTEYNGNKVDYTYDDVGNVTSVKTTVGAAITTATYSFDSINQLIGVINGNSKADYSYDENGNVTTVQYGNNVYSLMEYDTANKLTKVTNYKTDGTILNSYKYAYDANSNITGITFADGSSISYTYDALNRLKTETLLDGKTITYYYDAVGNRTKKEVTGGQTTNYTYDDANQLTAVNGLTYSYDNNGNMTSDSSRTYVYDAENRLIEVKNSGGSTIATYEYDALGRRTSKTVSGSTTKFYYDGDSTTVLYETDGNNNIVAQYNYDTSGKLISMTRGGTTYYYQFNGHGDVVALTDSAGAVVKSYSYDAYGNIISQTGSLQNPYLYAGYRYDEETGLYYLNARYYEPGSGRFITRDTFHGFEDDPASLNQYAYAHGNPIKYIDPTGHIANGWWNSVKSVGRVLDALIILISGGQAITGYYAAKAFLKKNKNKVVYQIRGKILSMFGKPVAGGLSAVIDTALTLVGSSVGELIAKGLDYADPWWGKRRNNGYIFG